MRRRSIIVSTFIGAFLSLLSASRAEAQHVTNPTRSYGVGIGLYNGPPYTGPSIGIYPLYYPGFYGNGASMYGPPIPTYAPVTGTFGASDNRINNLPPFFGTGLGWFGNRSPSPRPKPNFDYNPPGQGTVGDPPIMPNKALAANLQAAPTSVLTLEVRLPVEEAEVFVDDAPTKQSGALRTFTSPPFPVGEPCEYDIRAEWTVDGQKKSRTQTVSGNAGQRVVVDFVK